jgi:hypothetical protein
MKKFAIILVRTLKFVIQEIMLCIDEFLQSKQSFST